jgi:hypothetical protein
MVEEWDQEFSNTAGLHVTGSDLCNRALASWSGELEPTGEAKFSGSKC